MPSYQHRPTKLMNDTSHKVEKEVKLHTVITYLQDAILSAPAHKADEGYKAEKEVKLRTVTAYLQGAVMSALAHETNKRDSKEAHDV